MPGENVLAWSTVAASNGNADALINWAEGMPRASVNNSSRSEMAAIAKWRDLQNGSRVTGGIPNAQTFTSGVGFTAMPSGIRVLLTIGVGLTNTNTLVTLAMDGLPPVQVVYPDGSGPSAGTLTASSHVALIYNGSFWIILQDSRPKVNRSGDTMGGALTVLGNISSSGTISGVNISGTGNISGGTISTSSGNISATSGTISTGSGDISTTTGTVRGQSAAFAGTLSIVNYGSGPGIYWYSTTASTAFNISTGQLITALGGSIVHVIDYGGNLNITANGSKPGGGLWGDNSDARIKNVTSDYDVGLLQVKNLQPVRYSFKGNDTPSTPEAGDTAPYKNSLHKQSAMENTQYIGLIAQDIEQDFPELVTHANGYIDGAAVSDLRMLDASALIYALVNSVKELAARVETLEAK